MILVRKRVIYVIYQISDIRDRQKTDKIESMTKKGHQKCFALKCTFFLKKVISNFGQRNFVPCPPKLSLRPCFLSTSICKGVRCFENRTAITRKPALGLIRENAYTVP